MWDQLVEVDVADALDDAVLGVTPPCVSLLLLKFAVLMWPAHDLVLKDYGLGGICSTLLEVVAETLVRHV
jgi:hypothetical protein